MKKIISIILCLAMVFAMAATAFGATELFTIDVKKTDEDGNALAGAEFVLIPATMSEPAYSATSDASGIATFTNVSDGNYILKENLAPAGYTKSETEYNIDVINGIAIFGYETDDAGNVNPVPYETVTFVNKKEDQQPEENDPITVYIPITKVVEQTGFKAPGAETFKFEVYDFRYQGEVTVVSDTIETNGVGTYEGDIVIEVETIDVISEGFLIKETKGTKEGWTYSEAVYDVMPVFDDSGDFTGEFTYTIEENGDPVTYDEAVFVNSYYEKFNFAPMNPSKDILDDIIDIFDDDEPETPEVKEPEEVEEANPNTGAPVFAIPAVIAVLCGAALLGKRK